jgi:hypothetical protein
MFHDREELILIDIRNRFRTSLQAVLADQPPAKAEALFGGYNLENNLTSDCKVAKWAPPP